MGFGVSRASMLAFSKDNSRWKNQSHVRVLEASRVCQIPYRRRNFGEFNYRECRYGRTCLASRCRSSKGGSIVEINISPPTAFRPFASAWNNFLRKYLEIFPRDCVYEHAARKTARGNAIFLRRLPALRRERRKIIISIPRRSHASFRRPRIIVYYRYRAGDTINLSRPPLSLCARPLTSRFEEKKGRRKYSLRQFRD